jgi:hypothetical protein
VPMGTTVDKTYTLKEKEKTAKSKDVEMWWRVKGTNNNHAWLD